MAIILFTISCNKVESKIQIISIDFPHGENRLIVHKNGEAFLYYEALPEGKIIRKDTFNVDTLYNQLQPKLQKNNPREDWPKPNKIS